MAHLVVNVCADTTPNAETLTALLEGKPNGTGFEFCDLSQGDTLEGYKTKIFGAYVYVVGHGALGKEEFVDHQNTPVVNVAKIIKWCEDNGALVLIDTCCYPEQRLAKVKSLNKKIPYHCKKDVKKPVDPGINCNDTVPGFLLKQGIEKMFP